jgi:hypothetical protein
MSNTDNARQILIQRYSKLSNQSIEKIKSKLETKSIDDVILKHEKVLTISIITIVLIIVALIAQFVSLYYSKSITLALILNVLVLIIFQKGLHDNYEIRNILKTLKEIGLQ